MEDERIGNEADFAKFHHVYPRRSRVITENRQVSWLVL